MKLKKDYLSVMARSNDIMKKVLGLDYDQFFISEMAFDYKALMKSTKYSIEDCVNIQKETSVGNTPLIELKNLTELSRMCAEDGMGARIFVKDEAANPSGSFKDRRAACAVAHAKKLGYKGVMAATSGNYGAAVASQAAMQGLKCIIVQECYDSKGIGQPEIIEKARKCEALGAEVIQVTVGPELFYVFLSTLEDTGYFNASLYSPFGIAGVETLGYEIANQCKTDIGRFPDMVVCTTAGGGMITGTARGLEKAGAKETSIVAASIDLTGLHMASDKQFNKKSCTTGHTGFGIPHALNPDNADVPIAACRTLRFADRYVTTTQGEVMYMTELLANLEGLERGPAGNTALAAAFSLAQELPKDNILVVTETEYTGAGKHIQPQMDFARDNGILIEFGNPLDDKPGVNLVIPNSPEVIRHKELNIRDLRKSYIEKTIKRAGKNKEELTDFEIEFLADETKSTKKFVKEVLK